ncbi:titin isoform X2 [Aedes aegypti]|uniref:Uncharacterized protein n=1 Tax=Aedes aegypti TaxID=7159 RepID=A0A6I8TDX8_AEDAE|nr:titin isoform X2 [Aedes aegypti]
MDTTSAAAALNPGEGSNFGVVHVKQEPGFSGESSPGPEGSIGTDGGDGARTIRKITVLDPLKLKLLSRQNHNKLLSGLNAAKAKAQPPAPKPPPLAAPSSSASTVTEKETPSEVIATDRTVEAESEPLRPDVEEPPKQTSSTSSAPPKTGAGGGSTLFRRKKVVPVAIARKLAQKEKTKPAPKQCEEKTPPATSPTDASPVQCEPVLPEPVEQVPQQPESAPVEPKPVEPESSQHEAKEPAASSEPNPVEQTETREKPVASPPPLVLVKREPSDLVTRPTAFRRIKPKVAICLNPSRPKKSILKKTTSADKLLPAGSNEPSKSFKDLIPEETIVLDDDDEEDNEQHTPSVTVEEADHTGKSEVQRTQQEEAERMAEEETRRIAEEQRQKDAEDQRRIEEGARRKAEEQRRILAEQKKREEEEKRRIAEDQRRAEEEAKKVAEEQCRIQEEMKKREEEQRQKLEQLRIQEEQRKVAEEQKRLEMLEQEEKAKRVEPEKPAAESRKTMKIPPEIWKRQMERMKNNPNRQHSTVPAIPQSNAEPSQSQHTITSDPVNVKTSNVVEQEPVSVVAPAVNQERANQISEKPAVQVTPNPTKEIRRISRLPPSLAMKLMNCVALKPSRNKIEEKAAPSVKPSQNKTETSHATKEVPSSAPAVVSQTAIRRISGLSPSASMTPIKTAEAMQQEVQETTADKQQQSIVPESAVANVERTEKTEPVERTVISNKPAPTKEIKRIALPPDIALKLLGAVSRNKPVVVTSTAGTVDPAKNVASKPATIAEKPAVAEPESSNPTVTAAAPIVVPPIKQTTIQSGTNAPKEIRRISQLPPNVAMRLVDSLKQKGITVPKLCLKKDTPTIEPVSVAASDVQLPSEPSTPSSVASVPEIKVEPQEQPTKSKGKVEILSQVILPTASYNLEELLAGKSTEGFAPSCAMPLPLPMHKGRRQAAPVPIAPVPTSIHSEPIQHSQVSLPVQQPSKPETPAPVTAVPSPIPDLPVAMAENDIASEVTVTTENEDIPNPSHEKFDEYIISYSDCEGAPVQYDPSKSAQQQNKEEIPPEPNVTFVSSNAPTVMSHQYSVTYSANSHQQLHRPNVQAPIVIQQPANVSSYQPRPVAYFTKFTVLSQPGMNPTRMISQRMIINPAASMQSGQRPRYPTAQFVVLRHPTPIRGQLVAQTQLRQEHPQPVPQQSQQHLTVPRETYYHRLPIVNQNQPSVIVPTPRYVIPKQYPQIQMARPPRPQRPSVDIAQNQSKAFQPVQQSQPTTAFSIAQPVQQQRVIPKIVIDSSYVDQQERGTPASSNTPPLQDQWKTQNTAPCSEEIRNKLRDKLKSRMLQQSAKSGSPTVETPPPNPLSTPSSAAPKASPAKTPVGPPTIPVRNTVVYHPQDFQQRIRSQQAQPPKPVDTRIIKQYICQGRKIYLTKISVTKPTQASSSNVQQTEPPQQFLQYRQPQTDTGFHGFPQAAIKCDQRNFQQFNETVQQLERRKVPEPSDESGMIEIQNIQKIRAKMRNRKPSVVTAVTTHGLKGETFIITELNDPSLHPMEMHSPEVKQEVPLQHPPRITRRRNTFVVDDSDGDVQTDQLPQVEMTSQDDSQQDDKPSEMELKVEVENEEKEPVTNAERLAFDRCMKEEVPSGSESSQADEDLAREILALVENERKALRAGPTVKKVKKRRKRRKRHKKKSDGNEELMDLLMKHVNQESLIADIVASQQKKLPVIELSDTDENDEDRTVQRRVTCKDVRVKPDPDAETIGDRKTSCTSDFEESETNDIFAEILKPFVEEEEHAVGSERVVVEETPQKVVSGKPMAESDKACAKEIAGSDEILSTLVEKEKQAVSLKSVATQESLQNAVPWESEDACPEKPSAPAQKATSDDILKSIVEEVKQSNEAEAVPEKPAQKSDEACREAPRVLADEVISIPAVEEIVPENQVTSEEQDVVPEQQAVTLNEMVTDEQRETIPEEKALLPVEAAPAEQIVHVPKQAETSEISSKLVTEVRPEIESNQPTICDQTCDNSALPVKELPKKAPAQRAPKRKLKPTLVSRSKIRKVEPPAAIVTKIQPQPTRVEKSTEVNIEDSSDPFSDRDKPPLPDSEEERIQSQMDTINSRVRELVNEWDSDEEETSIKQPLQKYASFDNNGNLPCRISKNNALKRAAILSDPVLEVSVEESRKEESHEAIEDTSVQATANIVKPVRVTVLKVDLIERSEIVQEPVEPATREKTPPPPTEAKGQTVANLLKDWDESPIKQKKENAPVVARVLLDRLSSSELNQLKSKKAPEVSESSKITMEPSNQSPTIESKAKDSRDEISGDESERVVARIFMGGLDSSGSSGQQQIVPPASQMAAQSSPVSTGSPSKSRKSENKIPNTAESPTTRSKSSKQTSIKDWIQGSPTTEPSKPITGRRKGLRGRAASVLFEPEANQVTEKQKPAGRNLRSRTKSVFAEKPPLMEEEEPVQQEDISRPVEEPSEEQIEVTPEKPSGSRPEVIKEAGGTACAARKEQESKEYSTSTKPTPIIRNRVPIAISSEDEDDAPLAKRRKVLRKRRSMMRRPSAIRDLNANKRLFRGGATLNNSLIVDDSNMGETTFIKSEPPEEIEDIQDYYASPSESFAVTFPDNPSEQLLSVVTVQNNQVVHSQDFDAGSPFRNQYFAKDLIQSAATSTPNAQSPIQPPPPVQDHVFATPEPVRAAKRKRRTKLEMENDRRLEAMKREEEQKPEELKKKEAQRGRVFKSFTPVKVDAVDPNISQFECASCFEHVSRDDWDAHYAKHSGLTYRVNVDPVVDLNDETTAVAIVTRFMKAHRQVTLYCDKCNVAKKSALGLVSHRPVCGLTRQEILNTKIPCQHCGRKLMPVSMNCHLLGHCAVLKRKKQEEALETKLEGASADVEMEPTTLNQRGTVKRQATAKAERRIQNISFSEMILSVTKDKVTEGCLAAWKTQFRKAKVALCVFRTCSFTGTDEIEMRHHHEFCPSPCELLECKNCKFQTEKIDQMVKHIKLKHNDVLVCMTIDDSSGTDAKMTSESSDDEGGTGVDENDEPYMIGIDDEDKPKKRKIKTLLKTCKLSTRDTFNEESDVYREMILDEVINLRLLKSEFHLTAREWTAEFRRLHYSTSILFSALRPDLDVRFLTFNMTQEYIPKQTHSLRFVARSTNLYNAPIQLKEYANKWQNLEVFTGQVNEKDTIFFCGGPVVALDWLPIPDGQHEHQIVAVACKNDFEEFYLADRIIPVKCLIQIWDVGLLDNKEIYNKKAENAKPTLLYSIACDVGPIWALKFCPSGCYNSKTSGDDYDRLGLLAAAGSDGNIHIFSLGRSYEHLISNSSRVINLAPVLKLTLSLADQSCCSSYESHSAVKLAWSKSKHHSMLAAGYSNGTVAVWNATSTSPLLTGTKDNVRALLPVHKVFIPDSCVTAVDLHYSEDSRYLLVCNADRKVVVYDLNTGYMPMEICSLNARSKVTTACWNIHFPLITMAFDDVYAIDRCALTFHQPREIGVRLHPLYTHTAEATDMSNSDHLSTHVIGTDGGDVLSHKPMAFIHNMGQKNPAQIKYVLTSTISVKVNEEQMDNSYNKFEKNYCVLFSDFDKNPARMDLKSLQVKTFRRALLHEYPGIRINQVKWNPNDKSHQYYAIGYQAGFVRVRPFRLK